MAVSALLDELGVDGLGGEILATAADAVLVTPVVRASRWGRTPGRWWNGTTIWATGPAGSRSRRRPRTTAAMLKMIGGSFAEDPHGIGIGIGIGYIGGRFHSKWLGNDAQPIVGAPNPEEAPSWINGVTGVLDTLRHAPIVGADEIMLRALARTDAQDMETLFGDLTVAEDYGRFLADREEIEAKIMAEPTSAYAVGWALTLRRAAGLGLDEPLPAWPVLSAEEESWALSMDEASSEAETAALEAAAEAEGAAAWDDEANRVPEEERGFGTGVGFDAGVSVSEVVDPNQDVPVEVVTLTAGTDGDDTPVFRDPTFNDGAGNGGKVVRLRFGSRGYGQVERPGGQDAAVVLAA